MKLNLKKHLLFIAIVFSSIKVSWAQQQFPHSLSMGVVNGVANVNLLGDDFSTSVIGLDLSHQRNIGENFSFRSSLMFDYVFPVKYKYFDNDIVNPQNDKKIQYESRSTFVALEGSPMYYYHDKGFSVFLGLGGGIGVKTERSNAYYLDDSQNRSDQIYDRKDSQIHLGWKPTLGVVFKIGASNSPAEVELSIFREAWYTLDFESKSPFSWFGMCMAYRFNFMKG